MGSSEERVVAVIMVGGPTKGDQRDSVPALSLNIPKPLFPLAGQPMIHHPINACKRMRNLAQIYLIGFYEEREFSLFVSSISNELKIPVRYLREDKPHGSGGGLYYYRDRIMEDNPSHIFLLNCDVCCSFPLSGMLVTHQRYGGMGTIFVIKVSAESAYQFGGSSHEWTAPLHREARDLWLFLQILLEQDILSPLAGKKQLYTYETLDFWEQIKAPGMSLECSALYLPQYRYTSPRLLGTGDGSRSPIIIGDVYVHPSAKVHLSAKIGPNVSVSANAYVGPGARLISCVILDDVEIKESAVVAHLIVGWKSSVGR